MERCESKAMVNFPMSRVYGISYVMIYSTKSVIELFVYFRDKFAKLESTVQCITLINDESIQTKVLFDHPQSIKSKSGRKIQVSVG